MNPIISVITPCFNNVRSIEKCILSIKEQSNENIEHIIIDGGSEDGTVDIIKKYAGTYNMSWISEKDDGIADAMNKGFRLAKGVFFAWIDGDNYYKNDIFQKIISQIKLFPNTDIFCGYVDLIKNNRIIKTHKPKFPFNFKKSLFYSTGAIPVQPGVFFRGELFRKVNGFNTSYKIAGDYDFWVKILKLNPRITYLEEVFGYYLQEESGASQSLKGIYKGFKEMLIIGDKHGQNLYGKFFLTLKYIKGCILIYKQILLKNKA